MSGVRGFGQIQKIPVRETGGIRFHNQQRIPARAGCKFHAVAPRLKPRGILRADEIRAGKKILSVFLILEEQMADSVKVECIVHFRDLVLMRHQIIMEGARGTEVQTTAVRKQEQFLSPRPGEFAHPFQTRKIVIVFALEIE